jgi:hypothetical protein
MRVDLGAETATSDPAAFSASSDIGGSLRAYNYATRTLIESVSFSLLEGTFLDGGEFEVNAEGSAMVNGMLTNIGFTAFTENGQTFFSIDSLDEDSNLVDPLAYGTGEPGRSDLGLNIRLL